LQAELGLTKRAEVAVFRGFQPDEWIFGTEIGLLRKEPYLLSIGFINWSPHLNEDPQPFIEAGYWGDHHKVCIGAIHAGKKNELEFLLAHPGGPHFARKDDGHWTIPKGEAAPGEDLLTRAQIEFEEEVGLRPKNNGEWIQLGWIKQKGGKIVHAWGFEGDLPGRFQCRSNLFELEWPPRSGKYEKFPEVDQACFFSDDVAR